MEINEKGLLLHWSLTTRAFRQGIVPLKYSALTHFRELFKAVS